MSSPAVRTWRFIQARNRVTILRKKEKKERKGKAEKEGFVWQTFQLTRALAFSEYSNQLNFTLHSSASLRFQSHNRLSLNSHWRRGAFWFQNLNLHTERAAESQWVRKCVNMNEIQNLPSSTQREVSVEDIFIFMHSHSYWLMLAHSVCNLKFQLVPHEKHWCWLTFNLMFL